MSNPAPSTPAPTLAEVEKMLAMRADACIENAEQHEDPEFVPDDPSITAATCLAWAKQERDEAAHYRLALSCVRAVRAMEREGEKRQLWLQCDHLNPRSLAFEEEGPRRWYVHGQGMANNTRGRTLLEAVAAALPEPPHAE